MASVPSAPYLVTFSQWAVGWRKRAGEKMRRIGAHPNAGGQWLFRWHSAG